MGGAVQRISMRTRPSVVVTGTQVMASPLWLAAEVFRFMATPSFSLVLRAPMVAERWTEDERKVNTRVAPVAAGAAVR